MRYLSRSPQETENLGQVLGGLLGPGSVIALEGPLGAGKTCLARGILKGLGVTGYMRSPSFAIVHEYNGRLPAYHLDVYRLEGPGDMEDIGYEEYFYGQGVTIVEWAEKIGDLLPYDLLETVMEIKGPSERQILLRSRGPDYVPLIEEVSRVVGSGD